jgi:hypothetical protein
MAEVHMTMSQLISQIDHWIKTGVLLSRICVALDGTECFFCRDCHVPDFAIVPLNAIDLHPKKWTPKLGYWTQEGEVWASTTNVGTLWSSNNKRLS